jgi:hypothetical protein
MRLYLDGVEYDIITPEGVLDMEIIPSNPITNNQKLLSSDNYILKDKNGIYLTVKKEDE